MPSTNQLTRQRKHILKKKQVMNDLLLTYETLIRLYFPWYRYQYIPKISRANSIPLQDIDEILQDCTKFYHDYRDFFNSTDATWLTLNEEEKKKFIKSIRERERRKINKDFDDRFEAVVNDLRLLHPPIRIDLIQFLENYPPKVNESLGDDIDTAIHEALADLRHPELHPPY